MGATNVSASESNVLTGAYIAIVEGSAFTSSIYENGPEEIGFRPVVEQKMRESWSFRRHQRNWRVQLDHCIFLSVFDRVFRGSDSASTAIARQPDGLPTRII